MKRKIICFLLAFALALPLTGCGKSGTRIVRINSAPVITSAVTHIMVNKGFLENYLPEDATVEWTGLPTGPDIRDAIVSENIDIGDLALSTFITSYEKGLPLTVFSYCGTTNVRIYSNDPAIKKITDVQESDRISITNKGTTLHAAFLAYCREAFGDAMIYDNNLVAIPAADALASLQASGEFDAAIFSFPNYIKAENIGGLSLLADMSEAINVYSVGTVYVVNSRFYEQNPDIVEAFMKAQQETIQFMLENPEETAEILAELYGVDSAEIKAALEQFPPHSEIKGYDEHAQLLYSAGILTESPTPFNELPNYDEIPK